MPDLPQRKPTLLIGLFTLLLSLPTTAQESIFNLIHFDVYIETLPPAQTGARFQVDTEGSFPVDILGGRTVVPSNLTDTVGGPHLTKNPGWFMNPGFLIEGEDLRFRALGALRYWNPSTETWTNGAPGDETVRLIGGIPPEISDLIFANLDEELDAFWRRGTIWTAEGIQGPVEALVSATRSGGEVHTHLDFCLTVPTGQCRQATVDENLAKGAYLIELELFSTAQAGGGSKYIDSEPVLIVLGNLLTSSELQKATESLTTLPDSGQDVPQLPAAGILMMGAP